MYLALSAQYREADGRRPTAFIELCTWVGARVALREALVEIACRLFAAGKLALWPAAKLAGVNRVAFEHALRERQIAVCRPDERDPADDIAALDTLGI